MQIGADGVLYARESQREQSEGAVRHVSTAQFVVDRFTIVRPLKVLQHCHHVGGGVHKGAVEIEQHCVAAAGKEGRQEGYSSAGRRKCIR